MIEREIMKKNNNDSYAKKEIKKEIKKILSKGLKSSNITLNTKINLEDNDLIACLTKESTNYILEEISEMIDDYESYIYNLFTSLEDYKVVDIYNHYNLMTFMENVEKMKKYRKKKKEK